MSGYRAVEFIPELFLVHIHSCTESGMRVKLCTFVDLETDPVVEIVPGLLWDQLDCPLEHAAIPAMGKDFPQLHQSKSILAVTSLATGIQPLLSCNSEVTNNHTCADCMSAPVCKNHARHLELGE